VSWPVADYREQYNALTIFHLLIDEREQRRGYGRAALTQIIELAESTDGCDTVALTVNPRNHAAIRLYQSVGFEEIGTDEDGDLQMARAVPTRDVQGRGPSS
jgi:diamine N-acetyltransferase